MEGVKFYLTGAAQVIPGGVVKGQSPRALETAIRLGIMSCFAWGFLKVTPLWAYCFPFNRLDITSLKSLHLDSTTHKVGGVQKFLHFLPSAHSRMKLVWPQQHLSFTGTNGTCSLQRKF